MSTTIQQLSQLIATSVAELLNTCSVNNFQVPDLNTVFTPESEAFRYNDTAATAAKNIAAAAIQLAACVLPPQESTMQIACGHLRSAALKTAIECHVPEILREAGDQGAHADDIAAKTGVDAQKLARLLRSLANRHIFRETKTDVFVNNRLSSTLDTGKPVAAILSDPVAKHDNTSGKAALLEMLSADAHKASAYLTENMTDSATIRSDEPNEAPLQRALGTRKTLFELFEEPDQEYRRRRFGAAMKGFVVTDVSAAILKVFDWASLPKDALIVDVGGGIGSTSRIISKAYPSFNFVVQDAPSVTEDGIKSWNEEDPQAVKSGRVKFQGHDFFTPQPITNASVFLLKHILHDWSDTYNIKILSQLRKSATLDTLLLIMDHVIIPATKTDSGVQPEIIPGTTGLDPPSLLATGYTAVNDIPWIADIAMMVLHNAQERTVPQFDRLLTKTGWKMVKVMRSGRSLDSVLAKPI